MPNQEYRDQFEDLDDNYDPIFDFRPSKWLYDRKEENKKDESKL